MKNLKANLKKVLFTFTACLITFTGLAQINISIHVSAPFRYRLQDYASHVEQVQIIITNASTQTKRINLLGSVSSDVGIEAHMKSGYKSKTPLVLNAGEVKFLNGGDLSTLFDLTQLSYSGITQDQVFKQNGLPEGNYTLCISANDYDTGAPLSAASPAGCSNTVSVTNIEPPMILSPADQSMITASVPQVFTISWSTPAGSPPATQYRLRIAEVLGNRSPGDAMASQTTPPFFDKTVMGNIYVYNPGDPQLVAGRRYAVLVQAIDPASSVNFRNNGQSSVTSFTCAAANQALSAAGKQISIFGEFAWFMRQSENGPFTGSYATEGKRYGYYKSKVVKLMAHKQTYNVIGRLDALYQGEPDRWRTALTGLMPAKGAATEVEIATFTTTSDFGQVKNILVDNPATAEYNRVITLLNTTNEKSVTPISTYDFYFTITDPDFALTKASPKYPISPNQSKLDFGGDNHLLANTLRFMPKLVDYRGAEIPLTSAKIAVYKDVNYLKNYPAYINQGNVDYKDPSQADNDNDTTIDGITYRKIAEMMNVNGTHFVPGIFYNDANDNYLVVVKAPQYQTLYNNVSFPRPATAPKSTPAVSQTFTLYPAWNAQNLVLKHTKINISATFKWIMRQSEIAPYSGSYSVMNSKSSGYYNSKNVSLMAQRITYKVTGRFDTLYRNPSNWSASLLKLRSTKISTDTLLVASLGTQAKSGMIDNAEVDNLASIEYNRVAALLGTINNNSETTISIYNYYFSFNDPDFAQGATPRIANINPNQTTNNFGGVNVLMANTFRFVPKLVAKSTEIPLSEANVTFYKPLSFFNDNPAYSGQGTMTSSSIPTRIDTTVNGVNYCKVSVMTNVNGAYFVPGLFYTEAGDSYLVVVKVKQYQTICSTLSFPRSASIGTSAELITKTFDMVRQIPVFAGVVKRSGIAVANAIIWIAPTGVTKGGASAAYAYRAQTDGAGKFSVALNKIVPGTNPITFRVYDATNDTSPNGDYESNIVIDNYGFDNTSRPLSITLPSLVTVQGHVLDTVGNKFIPYPYVRWKRSSQNLIVASSDPNDHSLFSVRVPPRTDTLVISAEGYNTRSIPMNIRANANFASLEYRLSPVTYTVTLLLQDSNGKNRVNVPVTLVKSDGDTVTAKTDASGKVRFDKIPKNTTVRYSTPRSNRFFEANGTSFITKSVTINLTAEEGIQVYAFVFDLTTKAPMDANVYATQKDGEFSAVGTQYLPGKYSFTIPSNSEKPILITAQADGYQSITMQYDSATWYDADLGNKKSFFLSIQKKIIRLMGLPVSVSKMESSSSAAQVYTISGSFVRIPKNDSFFIDPTTKLDFENVQVTIDSKGNAQPTTGQTVKITTPSAPIMAFGYIPATLCGLDNQGIRVVDGQLLGAVKVDYSRFPIDVQLNLSGDMYFTSNPSNAAAASGISVFGSWDRVAGADSYFVCGGEPPNSGGKTLGLSAAGFVGNLEYMSSRVSAQGFGFLASFDISGATNNTTPGESTLVLGFVVDKYGNSSLNNRAENMGGGIYLSGHNLKLIPKTVSLRANGFHIDNGTLKVMDYALSSKSMVSLNFSNLMITPTSISGASFTVASDEYAAGTFNIYGVADFATENSAWQFGKNSSGNYYIRNPGGVLSATTKALKVNVSDFAIQTNGISAHAVSYSVNQNNVVIHYGKLADFNATALTFDNDKRTIDIPGVFNINLPIPVPMRSCILSYTSSLKPDTVLMPGNNFSMMGSQATVKINWKFISTPDSVYFVGDGLFDNKKITINTHALLVGVANQSAPRFYGNFQVENKSSEADECSGCILLGGSGYKIYDYYGGFRYVNSNDWNAHLGGYITDIPEKTNVITHADLNFGSSNIFTGISNTKFYDPAKLIVYATVDGNITIDFNQQTAVVQVTGQRDIIPNFLTAKGFGQLNIYFKESTITGFVNAYMSGPLIKLGDGSSGVGLLGVNADLNKHGGDYFGKTTYLTNPNFGATNLVQNNIFNGILINAVNKSGVDIETGIPNFANVKIKNRLETNTIISSSFINKTLKVSMAYSNNISGSVSALGLSLNFEADVNNTASGSVAIDNPGSITYSGSAGFSISSCIGSCSGGCGNGIGFSRCTYILFGNVCDPFSAYLKVCFNKTLRINCGTSGQPTISIN